MQDKLLSNDDTPLICGYNISNPFLIRDILLEINVWHLIHFKELYHKSRNLYINYRNTIHFEENGSYSTSFPP